MKTGVFGGSFDPIHWGHLVLAEEACLAAGLDRILLVPAGRPPHKRAVALSPYEHRLAMTRLAVEGLPGFEVSDVEADGEGPHYTCDTLARLAALRPGEALSFLLGSDSLKDMPGWRHPERILADYPLVVLPRPGFVAASAPADFLARATLVEGVQVALSSTLVRRRLAEGSDVRFLVPAAVRDYARRHRLYGTA